MGRMGRPPVTSGKRYHDDVVRLVRLRYALLMDGSLPIGGADAAVMHIDQLTDCLAELIELKNLASK